MKPNRIMVLGVAIASKILAMMLMMSSGDNEPAQFIAETSEQAPEAAPAPRYEIEGVLVAQREIPLGTVISESDLTWVDWPKQFAGPGSIRRSEDPQAIETLKGSVARVSFFHDEPIRREKLVIRGFCRRFFPPGRAHSRSILIRAAAHLRAASFFPMTASILSKHQAVREAKARRPSPTYACWRLDKPLRKRTANASSPGQTRRWKLRQPMRK